MDIELREFIEPATEFAGLGWSVQKQLEDVANGAPLEDQNRNALEIILDFLQKHEYTIESDDLRDEIEKFLEELTDK